MDAPETTHPDERLYAEALSRGLDYGQRRDGRTICAFRSNYLRQRSN
jgi:hypothetical protein